MTRRGKYISAFTAIFCIVVLVGCSTIMHGTRQEVGVSSTPTGALVTIDNRFYGNTPLFADLSRKDHHIIKIEMRGYGYMPFECTVTRSIKGSRVVESIVFGTLIGFAVDAISGALYKLTPEQVVAEFRKGEIAFMYKEDAVYVAVVLEPDPTWQKIANLRVAEGQ